MGILDDAIREHLELKRSHGASDEEIRRQEAEAFGPVRQDVAAPIAEMDPPAHAGDDHTQLLDPGHAPAEPQFAPDPHAGGSHHAAAPGDHPLPDAHDHAREGGADPAWGDDTELFAHSPEPAAAAGAGTLEPDVADPGPPIAPDHHHDEQHPALVDHDHIGGEEHPPEPVFGHRGEAPAEAPLEPAPVDDPPVGDPPVEHPEIDEPPPRQSPEQAHQVEHSDDPDGEDVLEETPEFLQDAPEHDRLWFEQKPPRDFDFGE